MCTPVAERNITPCSRFQTSGRWRKHSTSLDASGEVPRMDLERYIKRGETARTGSAFLMRLSGASFRGFHLTLPKRGGGYFSSPPARAGNLFVLPFGGQGTNIIPHPSADFKRETRFLEVWAHFRRVHLGRGGQEDNRTGHEDILLSYPPARPGITPSRTRGPAHEPIIEMVGRAVPSEPQRRGSCNCLNRFLKFGFQDLLSTL